jgi:hypothetical protein
MNLRNDSRLYRERSGRQIDFPSQACILKVSCKRSKISGRVEHSHARKPRTGAPGAHLLFGLMTIPEYHRRPAGRLSPPRAALRIWPGAQASTCGRVDPARKGNKTMHSIDKEADLRSDGLRNEAPADVNSQAQLDGRLDRALEETFPASDPVSVFITGRTGQ